MADNILTTDRLSASLDIAAKEIGAVKFPRNILTDPSGNDITPLTDAQLRASNVPMQLAALVYPASTANSSTAQLAAAASFTGTIETIQNLQAAQISVTCDQAYTVQVKQYIDAGGTRLVSTDTFTRLANVPLNENVTLPGNYFQIVVTNNGGSTTTTFRLDTTFGIMNTQPRALTNEGKFPTEAARPPALLTSYTQAGVIAINTVLATLDCSLYRGVSVQCTSMGTTGVVTPEWSNDNSTWVAATLLTQAGATATTFNAAGLWVLPVAARYLRLRLSTATTAGTTTLSVHQFDDRTQMWLATQPVSGTVTATVTGATQLPVTPTQSFINSAATTNATSVKASAGTVWSIICSNANAAARYVKFYNLAVAPTVGTSVPAFTIAVPANGTVQIDGGSNGIRFGTGIALATTTGVADSDTAAVAANEIKIATSYT